MATILFNAARFRAQFPEFLDPPNTDTILERYWDAAICYVSCDTEGLLSVDCRTQVLDLVTAHLIVIATRAAAGEQSGFVESATIDKISATIQSFANQSEFQFFLNQTPYGMQAFALLSAQSAGGFYLGGRNELGSFRRSGGEFVPPSRQVTPGTPDDACIIVTNPPPAPYSLDLGPLDGSFTERTISILVGCGLFSISFDSVDPRGSDVTVEIWTGLDTDSLNRFNFYYFDSDTRLANGVPDRTELSFDPTGMTKFDGVLFDGAGMLTGNASANPNLIVISGLRNSVAQLLNIIVAVG